MSTVIAPNIKSFLENYEGDDKPSFESYIQNHSTFIKTHCDRNDPNECQKWYKDFKRIANSLGIQTIKGKASVAWKELISDKGKATITTGLKRSFDTMDINEDLSNFLLPTYSSSFLFNSRSITEDMVKFAKDSFNLIKNRNGRCFAADLNKWLAIHNVLKINKKMDSELSPCFDAAVNEAMYRHFRSKVFGPPARLSATLRQEIIDYLLDLDEDNDIKKYKTKMNTLAARETGAVGRMVEALVNLASQMTKVEKPVGEKKAESILESVWSYLFKVNMDYDPHHFDNSLFKKPHPLSLCRPDYAVEVESSPSFVNLVGEVKPCSSAADGVALDLYRLGIFSLALYEHYGMESVMSFQAKGLDVTFYVTHFYQGIYLMCELETIKFPSTMSEYCHFGALDALLNVSSVFEKRCIQQPQQPQQSQPTIFFPYIKMKCMYGLSTNKSQKSTEKAPSSFLS